MTAAQQGGGPKSTRYFYTDSLAAAWMAKHFGMKHLSYIEEEERFVDAGARFIDCDDTLRELWQHDFSYLGKIYVHPDSLPLLEPRVGDALEFDRWHWERQRHEDIKNAPYTPHYGSVIESGGGKWLEIISAGVGWDSTFGGKKFSILHKIIQRDDKPFMWPEREET